MKPTLLIAFAFALAVFPACPTFNNNPVIVIGGDGGSDGGALDATTASDGFDAGPACSVNDGWTVEAPSSPCPGHPACLYKCLQFSPGNTQAEPVTDCVLPGGMYCAGPTCDDCPAWTMGTP